MTLFRRPFMFGLVALALAGVAKADPRAMLLSLQIEQNGQQIAAPRLLVQGGEPATVQVDDRMHLWLLAQPGEAAADIRLRLQVNAGAGLQHVGSPRVLALFGEESSIQWSGDAGATYRIVLRPAPVPLPGSPS